MVALSLEEEQERAAAAIDGDELVDVAGGLPVVDTNLMERDRRLALKLQEEEDKLAAQQEQRQSTPIGSGGGGASASSASTSSSSQQRHSPDSVSGRRSPSGK